VEGGASRSYGIEVGRLAGLPDAVVRRAREVLAELEGAHAPHGAASPGPRARSRAPSAQTDLFAAPALPHPVVEQLRALDPNTLTPMQALALLAEMRERSVTEQSS